ncbi:hypothetical protein IAT40_005178 [Kwoniella sp. CBS 6097]
MDLSTEAGPSRPSPSRMHLPLTTSTSSDVVMEDLSVRAGEDASEAGEPDEAVQLLLNISTAGAVSPKAESTEVIMEETALPPHSSHPNSSYPYTPPDESHAQHKTETTSSFTPVPDFSTDTPSAKPKQKRKRNTTGSSSRRASSDHPPHWLGEDNSIIRCICGFTEDDGFTIQCEGCGAWEHGLCFGYMDESQAPDSYFCELCKPRPFDADTARHKQMLMQQARTVPGLAADPAVEKDKPRSKGGKTKRARMESVVDAGTVEEKENSPGVMGPPAIKPKRRQQGGKPRAKQNSTAEGAAAMTVMKEVLVEEPEDDYFRVDPWMMEYTPIRENVVRGLQARQIMRNLYKEWVDEEEEMAASKSNRVIHNPSGLPSPTETGIIRLSPDNLFSAPDFSILAPPVPPVYLSGPDLEAIGSPISIKAVEDAPSFLPLTYAENISKHGVYTRPTIYSVYTDEPVMQGSFVGEYRGEILDCETYRRDPINQYASLGMPKPHVRSVGPPINLMIDARGYGCDLRFVRSGCHPNVVLRPFLWRKTEGEPPKLKFGLFAATDIGKKDELILGWEWDDQHVVHALRGARTVHTPGVVSKIDSVLTHIFGTFTACACVVPDTCALAQMSQIVDPKLGQKGNRVDLGELVGAVRGWRRREVETAEAKRWKMAEAFDLGLFRMSEGESHVDEEVVKPDDSLDGQEQGDGEPDGEVSGENESGSQEGDQQESEEEKGEERVEAPADSAMGEDIPEQEELRLVDVKEEEAGHASGAILAKTDSQQAPTRDAPSPHHSPTMAAVMPSSSPSQSLHHDEAHDQPIDLGLEIASDVETTHTEVVPKTGSASSPAHRPSSVVRMGSSSSLSSAMSSISAKHPLPDDLESGSDSDMTEATIPKSQFSESELDSATESEAGSDDDDKNGSGKRHNNVKMRQVLSPVIESGNGYIDRQMSVEEERDLVVKKAKKTKEKRIPASSPKSAQKQPTVPLPRRKKDKKVLARGRAKRIVSSSASEGEGDDSAMDIDGSPRSSSRHIASSPRSGKSVKLERLEAINSTVKPETPHVPVPSSALELINVTEPDSEITPPSFDGGQPALAPEAAPVEIQKELTPPPKEPTPPPPEPPKKVSLSDYLKNHRFRKEAQTPGNEVVPTVKVEATATATSTPVASIDGIPGFGATAPVPMDSTSSSPIKGGGSDTPSMAHKLNLYEHLPSSRTAPAANSPATPLAATPSTSYVPRSVSGSSTDHFPPQPSATSAAVAVPPSFVPRVSSSYTPRQASVSENESVPTAGVTAESPHAPANTSYIPRSSASEDGTPQGTVASLPVVSAYIPRSPRNPPTEMPPPLPAREPPPHTDPPPPPPPLPSTSPSAPSSIGVSRLPPTGPKVPPTGPRGLAGAPPIPSSRALGEPRGGYAGGRGYGRGGWRGRGFRGGWRGN